MHINFSNHRIPLSRRNNHIYHAFTCLHHAQVVAQKLQHLLALLLKAEWPVGWPTFVPDLLGAAQVPA